MSETKDKGKHVEQPKITLSPTAPVAPTAPATAVAPAQPSADREAMVAAREKAAAAKDWAAVVALSKKLESYDKEVAKAAEDARQAAVAGLTNEARNAFMAAAQKLLDTKRFDKCDGFWFVYEFGSLAKDVDIRLLKNTKPIRIAGSGGSSSYVTSDTPSKDMLARHGSKVLFAADTERTVDKQKVTFKAGTTYQTAWDYSTNGGWRNFCRQELLKADGIKS